MSQTPLTPQSPKRDKIKRRLMGIFILILLLSILVLGIHNKLNLQPIKSSAPIKPAEISPLEQGLAAEGRLDWDKALQIYKTALAKNPNQPSLWKRIADIDNHLKKHAEAAEAFQQAIHFQPNDALLYMRLADTFQVLHQPQNALKAVSSAVKLEPKNMDYLYKQGQIATEVNNLPLALESYNEILRINPNDINAVIHAKEVAIQLHPPEVDIVTPVENLPKQNLAIGKSDNNLDKDSTVPPPEKVLPPKPSIADVEKPIESAFKEAAMPKSDNIATDSTVSTTSPSNAVPSSTPNLGTVEKLSTNDTMVNDATLGAEELKGQGGVAEEEHKWDKAIKLYKESLAKNPNQSEVWVSIANIHNHLKRYAAAVRAFKKAILLQPIKASLYADMADSYQAMQNYDEALNAINEAVRLESKNMTYANKQTSFAKDAGAAAEKRKDWSRALQIYRAQLAKKPDQPDLWESIADIETSLKNYHAAIDATLQALKYKPTKLELYISLADLYTENKQLQEAYDTIVNALKLDPNKIALLLKKAEAAIALKDYCTADDTYQHILCLDINNREGLLGAARLLNARNFLDKAAIAYYDFLCIYPDAKSIWIDYAKIESWRGAYDSSFRILDAYYRCFGETQEYLAERARLLAMDGYYDEALCLVDTLLEKQPNDYELLYTKAIALNAANQFGQALKGLDYLTEKFPDNTEDNLDLCKSITTPLRSNFNVNPYSYYDSSKIQITGAQAFGQYFVNTDLSILYGIKREKLVAPFDSGFQTISGQTSIWDASEWAGLNYRVSPDLEVSAQAGAGQIQRRKGYFLYEMTALIQASETVQVGLQKGQNLYTNIRDLRYSRVLYGISPLSVSLGILQRYNRIGMSTRPTERSYIEISAEYDTFSDGNRLKFVNVSPHVTAFNSQYFNVDLGFYGVLYGFAREATSGYYSPLAYQLYQATTIVTFKASDNINFVLSAAAGNQKDNQMKEYEFAGDLSLKAILGIFSDWQLILTANGLGRKGGFNLGGNNPSGIDNTQGFLYNQYTFEGILTKRF